MSNLDKALAEITAIRGQMARASQFRGYGPATFAITGTLAADCSPPIALPARMDSITPRLYLLTRLLMASGGAK